jgi:hypothetical protein
VAVERLGDTRKRACTAARFDDQEDLHGSSLPKGVGSLFASA